MLNILKKITLIVAELFRGLLATANIGPAVTIFGSARFRPNNPYYQQAQRLASLLANNFTVITGGGPGIMEAANKGASLAGAMSIGCSIELPFETSDNPWIGKKAHFNRFFLRKFVMVRNSEAIVVFPGGFGTLDELFEILTLVQCRKQERPITIILYGTEYWKGLTEWMKHTLCKGRTIDKEDLDLFHIADSPEEAAAIILNANNQLEIGNAAAY